MDEADVGRSLHELLDLYSGGALSEDEFVQARTRLLDQADGVPTGVPRDVTAPAVVPEPRGLTSPAQFVPVVGQPRPFVETGPAPGHRARSMLIAASAVALLVALALGGFVWVRGQHTPAAPDQAAATAAAGKLGTGGSAAADPGRPQPVRADAALAGCVSQPSRDAAGNPTSYEPSQAVDGRADTAWRCDGDGVGQTLEIRFAQPHYVQSVGLIPGFAKTDPADGTDRYAQDRRIAAVRYAFDDGTTVVQRFDTDPGSRSVQSMQIPRVRTAHVSITILESVPGLAVNGQPAVDKVAVSEVAISGSTG